MKAEELKEFTENVNRNRAELAARFMYLDVCEEAYREQEARIDEIYTQVLNEGDYRVNRADYVPMREGEPKQGDRIVSEEWMFLLSEEDFARVCELAGKVLFAEGITDDKGRYVTNWMIMKIEAEQQVNEFFIRKIVPQSVRDVLWRNRSRVVPMEKMRNIARQMII